MRRLLLALWLLPAIAHTQEVQPVTTTDYQQLIHQDSQRANNSRVPGNKVISHVQSNGWDGYRYGYALPVKKLKIDKGKAYIQSYTSRRIYLGGLFTSTAGIRTANKMPALQHDFAQGRSINGQLQWQGADSDEPFSYGPPINSLAFDNSVYPYDVHGRLVPAGSTTANHAIVYDNDILRTGSFFEQALTLRARYLEDGMNRLSTNIRLKKAVEQLILPVNRNTVQEISANLQANLKKITLVGQFQSGRDRFSNSNRMGMLNRIYQQALLTPATFDKSQGYLLPNGQRSFSSTADNPWFLLRDNGNCYVQDNSSGSLLVEQKFHTVTWKLQQSLSQSRLNSQEQYKTGTAFFPNGQAVGRMKRDDRYQLAADIGFYPKSVGAHMWANINYRLSSNKTIIGYDPGNYYRYQRQAHEAGITYSLRHDLYWGEIGGKLANKMYVSNTTTSNAFFLPEVNVYLNIPEVFDLGRTDLLLSGTYTRFNSELPIDRSMGHLNLLQYPVSSFMRYFPVLEADRFMGLHPIRHREWSARAQLNLPLELALSVELFTRSTYNDVFPVLEAGKLQLKNMADHNNRGIELYLSHHLRNWSVRKLDMTNSVSFSRYVSKVKSVHDARRLVPLAGFSDVHKIIAKGEVLGAIAGNTYQRNAEGDVLIGDDGFPLAGNTPTIIGNPIPDFVMKFDHSTNWRGFRFFLNLEWKKGGQVWNGTQAVLDYYGRSQQTGAQRSLEGYLFPGVLASGHVNNIPVRFYDPSQPIEQNRWVRYGYAGVAADYMQRGDYLRCNLIGVSYQFQVGKKFPRTTIGLHGNNILLWTPYEGGDPAQLLFDQPNTEGLDLFNLPSSRSLAINISVQF